MSGSLSTKRITEEFMLALRAESKPRKPDRRKRAPPVSIRFSDEERRLLSAHAGNKALSTYVREFVLSEHKIKRKPRKSGLVVEKTSIAQILAALGRSGLPSLLRETLDAIDDDKLLLDDETEYELRRASAEIVAMRATLVKALGLRGGLSP